jgi:hypothetical protein
MQISRQWIMIMIKIFIAVIEIIIEEIDKPSP